MKACAIDGCEKPSNTRGWCSMHYCRWKRHGDPLVVKRPKYEVGIAEKPCTACGQVKPVTEFFLRPDREGLRRSRCKACMNEATRRDYAANPEKHRAWRKAKIEKHREYSRAYYVRHRERAIAANLRWQKKNPANTRAASHRRRLRELEQGDGVALEVVERLMDQPCAYCGGNERMTIDHVVPLYRGGKHQPDNLLPACKRCNSSKGVQLVAEWFIARPLPC